MDVIRMHIRAEHAEDALACFQNAGFQPARTEDRGNEVAFEFTNVASDQAYNLLTSVPAEYSAIQGLVGGPPFRES